jgi:hypothetical protein
MRNPTPALSLLFLVQVPFAFAAARAFQLPTATEVFRLRSACAALGQKILDDNAPVGLALSKSQVSHYDPSTNRCYVELDIVDTPKGEFHFYHRALFDGQTGEVLAFANVEKKWQKSGKVFDKQHDTTNLNNAGWDDANDYIDAKMADDRE